MTCKKLKYLLISRGQECVLPIFALETAAEAAGTVLGTVQAHGRGGVLPKPLAWEKNSQARRAKVAHPASGHTGETGAQLW